jgi:TolB-like protein
MGLTRAGEYLGTPRYMAPEQVEGHPVDQRTDIYSLGLILYEMTTGDVPFVGTHTLQVMYQRVKDKPKNPKLHNPELPDDLVRVILRCLETKPEDRYQSAAEVLMDLGGPPPTTVFGPLPGVRPKWWQRWWMPAASGSLVLLAILLTIPSVRNAILRRPAPGTSSAGGIPAISQGKYVAVLPFRVLGEQSTLGYIAEGLMEALSAKLFQVKNIRVASAGDSREASKKDSLEKIGRALGANLLVQGSVQGAGDRIRITVSLDDLASNRRVWSGEFSGLSEDLLTLEDQIYGGLVAALELQLSQEEMARTTMHPTGNVEAYDLYLRGRTAMRGQQDVKNVEAAIGLYEQALKKDPSFALAYAGLADAGLKMYAEKKDSAWADRALKAAQEAQRLNDNLAEVHISLGSVYRATGKTAQAIAELDRALQLSPNSDEGYRRLGSAYLAAGRKQEAISSYQKAVDVNPYFWLNHNTLAARCCRWAKTKGRSRRFSGSRNSSPTMPWVTKTKDSCCCRRASSGNQSCRSSRPWTGNHTPAPTPIWGRPVFI